MSENPLLSAIEELQTNCPEIATRPWAEVGRLLAICQCCPQWERWGCHQVDVRPGPFALFLCDATRACPVLHDMDQPSVRRL